MIVLLQVLKMLKPKQRELFVKLFTDWTAEANELGYTSDDDLGEFANNCMSSHFGFEIEDQSQLIRLVQVLKRPTSVQAALTMVR